MKVSTKRLRSMLQNAFEAGKRHGKGELVGYRKYDSEIEELESQGCIAPDFDKWWAQYKERNSNEQDI